MYKRTKLLSPLGTRIQERFSDLGITQEDVATACRITQSAVSQIMARGTTKHLHTIAKVLKTTTEWLADGEGPKSPPVYTQEPTAKSGMADGEYTGCRRRTFTLLEEWDKLTPQEQEEFMTMANISKKSLSQESLPQKEETED